MTRPSGGLLFPREDYASIENGLLPPGGTVGQVLTKNSSADYDSSWQTPTGGGGGGTPLYYVWDPLVPDATPDALSDEFEDDSIADYTQVYGNGDSTTVIDIATTKPGAAYISMPSMNWHWHSILKALPAGDFTIFTGMRHSSRNMAVDGTAGGLVLSTAAVAGSGAQAAGMIGRFPQTAGAGLQISGLLSWNGFGSSASGAALSLTNYAEDGLFITRLRRVGTDCYKCHSSDGKTWEDDRAFTNAAWTHFGLFGINYSGAPTASVSFEFLRYHPVGTQLDTGGARAIYG